MQVREIKRRGGTASGLSRVQKLRGKAHEALRRSEGRRRGSRDDDGRRSRGRELRLDVSPQVILEDILSLELATATQVVTGKWPDVHVVQLVSRQLAVPSKLLVASFDITREQRFLP